MKSMTTLPKGPRTFVTLVTTISALLLSPLSIRADEPEKLSLPKAIHGTMDIDFASRLPFLPEPMPMAAADFTAILDEAFRAEASAAYLPRLITGLLIIAACVVAAWLLQRYLKMRRVILPRHILLIFALIFGGMGIFQVILIRSARTVRNAALAEIPDKVQQANGLVQRLLADSTGTAISTESGTYLALAGGQVFLPKPVADTLQRDLTAKNLRLP